MMYTSIVIYPPLLATKCFLPAATGTQIARPRLTRLLQKSLKHPLTLVSAPAGFGKTMVLSSWAHTLKASNTVVAWVSLDEEDNDPRLFWTYILSALSEQQPTRFTSLFKYLQSPEAPPLTSVLAALSNLLLESPEHVVLILDDYHLISNRQVHTMLSSLVEHQPTHMHLILSTRVDPSLSLSQLRARRQLVEVRTDQLRCTAQETKAFFQEVMGLLFPDQTIIEITARTEGWLVGLQLLGLSLPEHVDPLKLLEEATGNQRYILDYLTEVVLRQQPQEVQTFLLSTSILEQLSASLCDAVLQQQGSQQMLRQLEETNLFVVCLDSKRQWYRYHALFAEALRSQLEQRQPDTLLCLHQRASHWYAQHGQETQAILHALRAKDWPWAAELIERQHSALNRLTWGISKQKMLLLRDCLEQIPVAILHARPRLCLACTWMELSVASPMVIKAHLTAVETRLTADLVTESDQESSSAIHRQAVRQERENLLGEAITYRALMQSYEEDGEAALALCQQAQALLSADNVGVRGHIAATKLIALYASATNDAVGAVQMGLQGAAFSEAAGSTDQAISLMGLTAMHLIGTGHLRQTQQLTQQALLLGRQPGAGVLSAIGWPLLWQAEVLREWNQLEAARALVEEAIPLCEHLESPLSSIISHARYAMVLRVCLSYGALDEACAALQELKSLGNSMNQPYRLYFRSHFTTVDQVRLWLACKELDRATRWMEAVDLGMRHGTPFAHEREEVACARILLAQKRPALALQRLESVLKRATRGQRWGHVIEILLLQTLAYQMGSQQRQARDTLLQAVRLAQPEGPIRCFVDEGTPLMALLSQVRHEQDRQQQDQAELIPYLDTVLAAFP